MLDNNEKFQNHLQLLIIFKIFQVNLMLFLTYNYYLQFLLFIIMYFDYY